MIPSTPNSVSIISLPRGIEASNAILTSHINAADESTVPVGFGFRRSRVIQPQNTPLRQGIKVLLESGQAGRVKKIVVAR